MGDWWFVAWCAAADGWDININDGYYGITRSYHNGLLLYVGSAAGAAMLRNFKLSLMTNAIPPPLFRRRSTLTMENSSFLQSCDVEVSFVSSMTARSRLCLRMNLTISSILVVRPLQLNLN